MNGGDLNCPPPTEMLISDGIAWVVIGVTALVNMQVGRIVAEWGLPRSIVGRPKLLPSIAFIAASLALAGFFVWARARGLYQLSVIQWVVAGAATPGWYRATRERYAKSQPWSVVLNARLKRIARTCEREGCSLTSDAALADFVKNGRLRFNERDYDEIVQGLLASGRATGVPYPVPQDASGAPDYHAASVHLVRIAAAAICGHAAFPGLLGEPQLRGVDMSGLDYDAFEKVRRLALAFEGQGQPVRRVEIEWVSLCLLLDQRQGLRQ